MTTEGRRSSWMRLSLAAALAVGLQIAVAVSLPKESSIQMSTPVPEPLAVELVAPPAVAHIAKPAAPPAPAKTDPAPQKTSTVPVPKAPVVTTPDASPSKLAKQKASSLQPPPPTPSRNPPRTQEKTSHDAAPPRPERTAEAAQRGARAVKEATPDYLSNPSPDYPAQARRQGWTGTVVLRVQVDAGGGVRDVRLVTSAGHKVLDDAARKAVLGWRFDPAKRNGVPVVSWVDVPIRFEFAS